MISTEKTNSIKVERPATDQQKIMYLDPYTSLFRDALLFARKTKASDIHIEPTSTGLDIRMRVHGILSYPWKELPMDHRDAFIAKLKRITNLSISVSGKPQDARMSFPDWKLNLRVNLFPTLFGEKICLRLLDQNKEFRLEQMGFDGESLKELQESLSYKNGVVLISGPTGSGKTTTLYSMICAIDRIQKNIVTLEDPIEYEINGINQGQISKSMCFADALRSVLRQDPDVILVGEVRDKETADLCFKAASTGHLVLSTVHANGALEVISRLMGLDVDPQLIRSNLRFSGAQRLFGKLCPHCSIPFTSDVKLRKALSLTSQSNYRTRNLFHPCSTCQQGLIGQVPILEFMNQEEIRTRFDKKEGFSNPLIKSLSNTAMFLAERGEIDTLEALYAS